MAIALEKTVALVLTLLLLLMMMMMAFLRLAMVCCPLTWLEEKPEIIQREKSRTVEQWNIREGGQIKDNNSKRRLTMAMLILIITFVCLFVFVVAYVSEVNQRSTNTPAIALVQPASLA